MIFIAFFANVSEETQMLLYSIAIHLKHHLWWKGSNLEAVVIITDDFSGGCVGQHGIIKTGLVLLPSRKDKTQSNENASSIYISNLSDISCLSHVWGESACTFKTNGISYLKKK